MTNTKKDIKNKSDEKDSQKWIIANGDTLEYGNWYATKRGFIIKVEDLHDDGQAKVISHRTGNPIVVSANEISQFTIVEDPGTPCGTIIGDGGEIKDSMNSSYNGLYIKYPHIVEGSIYRVQSVGSNNNSDEKAIRKRRGHKTTIKGQVRCKILCQEPGCKNQRDIKVQDAFQVKKCDECKKKSKKKKKNDKKEKQV